MNNINIEKTKKYYDGYYAVEDFEVSCAMNNLQRFFNMYKDDYYA